MFEGPTRIPDFSMNSNRQIARSSPYQFVASLTATILVLASFGLAPLASSQIKPKGTEHGIEDPVPGVMDQFHPDRPRPKDGGQLRVHVPSDPRTLNYLTHGDNNSVYLIWQELTDRLAYIDWTTGEISPGMAESWTVEDTVLLKPDPPAPSPDASQKELLEWEDSMRGERFMARRVFGRVYEYADSIQVLPESVQNPLEAPLSLPKDQYHRIDPATTITLKLRQDVTWHDGVSLNADDLMFTMEALRNPHVQCDWLRGYFSDIREVRKLDEYTVRFVFSKPYFQTLFYVTVALRVLPAHQLRLEGDNRLSEEFLKAQATRINEFSGLPKAGNENLASGAWLGNGPYRITKWEPDQFLELKRYDGYYGPRPSIETIRYKFIPSRQLAYLALKAGELDFIPRLDPIEFYEDAPKDDQIEEEYVRALYYSPHVTFVSWNNQKPGLSDPVVRRALTLGFDRQRFIDTYSYGVGIVPSGDQYYFGPAYDRSIEPLPFDPVQAEQILEEGGWYDRDGNGTRDRDGVELAITYSYPNSSDASVKLGREMKNAYQRLGIKFELEALDFATLLEKLRVRDYDASPLMWTMDPEADPFQNWHSTGATPGSRTSNYAGMADSQVDELITQGRKTIDNKERWHIWHRLHQRIHELQPMMFLTVRPERALYHRRYRGVVFKDYRPGFRLRDWFIAR